MNVVSRLRERLVLGPVRQSLGADETVLAWSHAALPGTRAPGLLVVTQRRCLLQVANRAIADVDAPLERFRVLDLHRRTASTAQLRLQGDGTDVVAEFSLTSRHRARAVGRVLAQLARADIRVPNGFDPSATSPLPPVVRGVRDHARRVWTTVVGVLLLAVSLLLASPFVPGPGALTAVAGLAVLAREYEWARDVHLWAARQADRFVAWLRARRRRGEPAAPDQGSSPGQIDPAPRCSSQPSTARSAPSSCHQVGSIGSTGGTQPATSSAAERR